MGNLPLALLGAGGCGGRGWSVVRATLMDQMWGFKDYMLWGGGWRGDKWTMFWDSPYRLFALCFCNNVAPRRGVIEAREPVVESLGGQERKWDNSPSKRVPNHKGVLGDEGESLTDWVDTGGVGTQSSTKPGCSKLLTHPPLRLTKEKYRKQRRAVPNQ